MFIAPACLSTIRLIATSSPKIMSTSTNKLSALVAKYFGLGKGIFFLGYGAKELFIDGFLQEKNIKPLDKNAPLYTKIIHKIQLCLIKNFKMHGTLYILSAITLILADLDKLNMINFCASHTYLQPISNILFLGACVLTIGYQANILKDAIEISRNGNDAEKNIAKYLKTSCILGILSSLGYIAAIGFMIVEGPIFAAAGLGLVAISFGGMRILYDYSCLTPALKLV